METVGEVLKYAIWAFNVAFFICGTLALLGMVLAGIIAVPIALVRFMLGMPMPRRR